MAAGLGGFAYNGDLLGSMRVDVDRLCDLLTQRWTSCRGPAVLGVGDCGSAVLAVSSLVFFLFSLFLSFFCAEKEACVNSIGC